MKDTRLTHNFDLLSHLEQPVDMMGVREELASYALQDHSVILLFELIEVDFGEAVQEALR